MCRRFSLRANTIPLQFLTKYTKYMLELLLDGLPQICAALAKIWQHNKERKREIAEEEGRVSVRV